MLIYGSAYPVSKLALNSSLPPILFAALRNGILFIFLIPFCNFFIPNKKFILPLIGFSLSFGVGVFLFMNLALYHSSVVSPIIIGAQLGIPFGIICSYFILNERIYKKKWLLIFTSFIGIIFIGFDPKLFDEIFALILVTIMSFFYGLSQVFSRLLKDLDVKLITACTGLMGLIVLFIFSIIFEGNSFQHLIVINIDTWLLIFHSSIIVSLVGHMSMFYLYKFYPVDKVLPFYALFPIFGILLTFFIFFEIPGFFEIIGGIIVIGSVYLIHLENNKKNI